MSHPSKSMALKRMLITVFILLVLLALKWLPVSQAPSLADPADNKESLVVRWDAEVTAPLPTTSPAGYTASPQAIIATTPIQSRKMSSAPSPTTEWTWNPPGDVVAPILIYHHIAERKPASRYFLSPGIFEAQMRALQRWGYTSIPLSLLVKALTEGAFLPLRPVVITFDDGYRDVYTYAFPILRRFDYSGVVYVIAGQVGVGKYMDAGELSELAAAGWEIGSHSWSHINLRNPAVKLQREIDESRLTLEELLAVPVETFAFPYGLTSKYVTDLVKDAGYQAAVGLGGTFRHTKKTRYYLSRIEIRSNYDMKEFVSLLPWTGNLRDEKHPSNDEGHGFDGE